MCTIKYDFHFVAHTFFIPFNNNNSTKTKNKSKCNNRIVANFEIFFFYVSLIESDVNWICTCCLWQQQLQSKKSRLQNRKRYSLKIMKKTEPNKGAYDKREDIFKTCCTFGFDIFKHAGWWHYIKNIRQQ